LTAWHIICFSSSQECLEKFKTYNERIKELAMEKNKEKKEWEKPCLTIILRGRIEENVLNVCGCDNQGNPNFDIGS